MTFRQLALKNVRGKWRSYAAYMISGAMIVCIFYMFMSFIFHPDVTPDNIRQGETVQQGLISAQYIIVLFAIVYLLYAHTIFLRNRQQEFGIYTLFGMTPGQLARLMTYENTIISTISIVLGVLGGLLFSKLFFMALSAFMQVEEAIAYHIPLAAVIITAVGFFVLYQLVNVYTAIRIKNINIVDTLKEKKRPRTYPAFSFPKTVLSLVLLTIGYVLAYIADGRTMMFLFLPVVIIISVATFLFFNQGSIWLLDRLRKSKRMQEKGTALIALSQLTFKMKDNARMLALMSMFMTVVICAGGTLIIFYQALKGDIMAAMPHSITIVEEGLHSSEVIDRQKMKEELQRHGETVTDEHELVGIPTSAPLDDSHIDNALVVEKSSYNDYISHNDYLNPIDLQPGEIHVVQPVIYVSHEPPNMVQEGESVELEIGGEAFAYSATGQSDGKASAGSRANYLYVVHDDDFHQMQAHVNEDDYVIHYAYDLENWERSLEAMQAVEALVSTEHREQFMDRVGEYASTKQGSSITIFVGSFICLLFFFGILSILYVKLFTEYEQDRHQYRQLRRIGLTEKEYGWISGSQMIIVFFLPLITGILHALFAFKTLHNSIGFVLPVNVYTVLIWILPLVFIVQFIYYLIAKNVYVRQMVQMA